jgi:hypothetical protein
LTIQQRRQLRGSTGLRLIAHADPGAAMRLFLIAFGGKLVLGLPHGTLGGSALH